jgi:hypothetical protein
MAWVVIMGKRLCRGPKMMKLWCLKSSLQLVLRMPPHPVLADILLKYQIQVHHLTPNDIVQLSKYVWAGTSFGGVPSAEGFMKRYKLHY